MGSRRVWLARVTLADHVVGPMAAGASAAPFAPSYPQAAAADAQPRLQLAQFLPFERNKVQNMDPRQAFVEGYQAYNRGDWIATIERMNLVAVRNPRTG